MKQVLDICPNSHTDCQSCNSTIPAGTLRLADRYSFHLTRYYHLSCWSPAFLHPLSLHHFRFSDSKARELQDQAEVWIDTFNQQFLSKEENVPVHYLRKAVSTTYTPFRRLLLEVFLYLSLKEVETLVACVCKNWLHVSRDNELYRSRYMADFHPSETEGEGDYRRKYVAYWQGACWHCKSIPAASDIFTKCVYFNKPLCTPCAILPECRETSLEYYSKSRHVSIALLKDLQTPTFPNSDSNYTAVIARTVVPFMKERKTQVLAMIETEYVGEEREARKRCVEEFREERYYNGYGPLTAADSVIASILGRKGKEEAWKYNAKRLLGRL